MILLNDVVHVLAGSSFAFLREQLFLLQVMDGANVGGILIDVDYSRIGDMQPAQDFSKKPLSRSSACILSSVG